MSRMTWMQFAAELIVKLLWSLEQFTICSSADIIIHGDPNQKNVLSETSYDVKKHVQHALITVLTKN